MHNEEIPQMKMLTRIPNTMEDGPMPGLKKNDQPQKARLWWEILALACLILVLELSNFVHLTNAHSGFDPEIAEITEKLTKDPQNVDLLIRRGQIYRSNGKLLESLQDMEQAWLLDRENRIVILQRALTLSALGRNQEAEAAFNYFLQEDSDPNRVIALAERAHIRAETGRVEQAIEDYTAVLLLQPNAELYFKRGQLQESLGRLDEAASGYEEGIAKLGNSILLKKGLLNLRIIQGKWDQALVLIDEQLTRSSVKTQWYIQRAEIFGRMGQADAAQKSYQQALSETNRNLGKRPTALNLVARAKILNAMGKRDEAIRDLRVALKKSPQFDEAEKLLLQWDAQ